MVYDVWSTRFNECFKQCTFTVYVDKLDRHTQQLTSSHNVHVLLSPNTDNLAWGQSHANVQVHVLLSPNYTDNLTWGHSHAIVHVLLSPDTDNLTRGHSHAIVHVHVLLSPNYNDNLNDVRAMLKYMCTCHVHVLLSPNYTDEVRAML